MPMFHGLLASALAVCGSAAYAGFTNGGFETGDFTGWSQGGSADTSSVEVDGADITGESIVYAPAVVNVHSGDYAAKAVVAHGREEYFSLSQSVELTDGEFQIGFFLGTDAAQDFSVDAALANGSLGIYLDGDLLPFTTLGATDSFIVRSGSDSEDMHHFATQFVATAGDALVEFRFSGSGSARVGLSIDDLYATPLSGVGLRGDYNNDHVVDAADYTAWRDACGDGHLVIYSGADGNGDGEVTFDDYEVWANNYGATTPTTQAFSAAPEPATLGLACLVALAAFSGRRR